MDVTNVVWLGLGRAVIHFAGNLPAPCTDRLVACFHSISYRETILSLH